MTERVAPHHFFESATASGPFASFISSFKQSFEPLSMLVLRRGPVPADMNDRGRTAMGLPNLRRENGISKKR
jgi:hypothetical protein